MRIKLPNALLPGLLTLLGIKNKDPKIFFFRNSFFKKIFPDCFLNFRIQWNLDLRKPDLRKNLDLRKIVGATDFLVNKLFDLTKIF